MWDLYIGEWIGVGVITLISLVIATRGLLNFWTIQHRRRARKRFRHQRERLEARFFDIASATGKPRGLRWVDVDFEDAVCFAVDREKNQLLALVGVTIGFEAVEGGGMEEVEAVGNL